MYLSCSVSNQRDHGNKGNHHGNMKINDNLSTKVNVVSIVSTSQNIGDLSNQGNHGNNNINVNLSTKVTVVTKVSISITKYL